MFEFLLILAQQPLFRLLGALIVLFVTDYRPVWGAGAFVVWALWIYLGSQQQGRRIF
jgi:hypothetical protein